MCDGCCHWSLAVPSAQSLVSSGPSSVLAALNVMLMYAGIVYEILAAATWLAMVAVAAGVVDDVAGDVNGIVEAERFGSTGQRCSTPTMLVSTCCIDIRVGGTIPGTWWPFGH